MKNQFIVLPKVKDIIDSLLGIPAPSSDINLFRERQYNLANEQKFIGDNGYQGSEKITTPPHKRSKKKGQKLTEHQKK